MQYFQNTVDLKQWAFEDDVVVTNTNGVYSFQSAAGIPLNVPTTLVPYSIPASVLLAAAQMAQITSLSQAYATACLAPVSYTSKGNITKTYQADQNSIDNLTWMLLTFSSAQTTPSGFYWIALDNTQVPFTFADLQGLAAALGTQGASAFAQFQLLKAQVKAATTVADVQAIVWS